MARFLKNKEQAVGQVPGELLFIGKQKMEVPAVQLIEYSADEFSKTEVSSISDLKLSSRPDTLSWINIHGLHDIELIKEIGKTFHIHPLTLEDILNTGQRPKMEEYDNYLFFNLKMLQYNENQSRIFAEQISMVVLDSVLITFQEQPGDVFGFVRERLEKHKGRIRVSSIDYLAYTLLDTIVDNYLIAIERIGDKIEDLEGSIIKNPSRDTLDRINNYKQEMTYLRKTTRPCREFILLLNKSEHALLHNDTQIFIKDLLDLITQVVESVDTYKEILSDYLNMYNTAISNNLNEIMKVLTIFSAIFIPLTFIAGIYGTNFQYMPELGFKYGYPIFLGVLVVVAGFMIRYFKKKRWF